MISLNQFTVEWKNSKSQIKIQRKKGKEGSYIELFDNNAILTGSREADTEGEVPLIRYTDENLDLFHRVLLSEDGNYYITVLLPKKLVDFKESTCNPFEDNYVNQYIEFYPPRFWREMDIKGELFIELMGELNTKNFVGIMNLSLGRKQVFLCEIAAKKINYEDDYRNFLNEIAEESSNLIMQYGGLSHYNFVSGNTNSNEFSKIIQLRSILRDLPLALDTIMNRLHNKLEGKIEYEPIGIGKSPDVMQMITNPYKLELQSGGILREKFSGYTPQTLITVKRNETIDTLENRYVKDFLKQLYFTINPLKSFLERELVKDNKKKIYPLYISEVRGWMSIIEDYLNSPTFRQISNLDFFPSNSQVLQNRVGYQDILLLDIRLQSGLLLSWNPIKAITNDIYLKPVFELYEIWCFFVLRNTLRDIIGPENKESNLLSREEGNINFNLKKGTSSSIVFERNRTKITFYYNKEFSRQTQLGKSYSLKFKPDFTVHIMDESDKEKDFFIHFDAKYKVQNLGDWRLDNKTSKKEDLIKMHAYKDGIINSLGAYVLYPGNEFINFKEGSEVLPGVGAIPLSPNNKESRNILKVFLTEIFEYIYDDYSK